MRHAVGIALALALLWAPQARTQVPAPVGGDMSNTTVKATGASAARKQGDRAGEFLSPIDFGAKGDGTTDDRAAVQAAINAAAGKTLYLGPHKYCIGSPGLVVYHPVAIRGEAAGNLYEAAASQFGFVACATNINLLTLGNNGTNSASGSTVTDLYFDMGAPGVPTSGAAIVDSGVNHVVISNVRISQACIGIDEPNSNASTLDKIYITSGAVSIPGAACGGIRVGHGSTGSLTSDLRITDSTIDTRTAWSLLVEDAGGLFLDRNDFLYAVNGMLIRPGDGQDVVWMFANSSALSDSTCSTGLIIDTTAATAKISGLHFNQTWTASAGNNGGCIGAGVAIQNGGGGVVKGIHFVGHRSYTNGGNGFAIASGVSDVTINSSEICANSTATLNIPGTIYNGIDLASGAAGIAIRGNRIGGSCVNADAYAGFQGTGIFLGGNNSDLTIVGNDLRGNAASGIGGSSALTGSNVISNNSGSDDTVPNVAAAASITLPLGANVAITGGAAISGIAGMWPGRAVNLTITGTGTSFVASSSVCNAKTVAQFDQVVAYQMPGTTCAYLR